ncbi:hypothetical protein DL96DRAFT_1824408 [Flagelloscypha sp. PMI_526]|nr:hypothetical protein DL96DRAFT_1824408 [Flagelloscypha sp. PMI_526]
MPNLRLTLFLLLQLVATCFAATSIHHPRGLSNAERLRRGLPLKAPVFRRGTPTRRNPQPSNLPVLTTYSGRVKVLDNYGSQLGWLNQDGTVFQSKGDSVQIELSAYPGSSSGLIAKCLSCNNPQNLGLSRHSGDKYTTLAKVGQHTTTYTTNKGEYEYEPQVWSFDSATNALELSYVADTGNTWTTMKMGDGSTFVVARNNGAISGDIVKLKLVPLSG